jgi:ABC-2 type transport system ATP-binding protein
MIRIEGLRKQYGDLLAVDDVSFVAEEGKIFGLLGPNGAGKSTTISCISGLLKPTAGHISVLGHDVVNDGRDSRKELGVVPQELALYEDLSATENLVYWGSAFGLRGSQLNERVNDTLSAIGLLDRAKEPVRNYSGGMKRRLNFGCGVVHNPKVLLLDEPTVGVDPQSRERLLDLVREQVDKGTCVLYTTHYMEEAENLCDKLAIIDHGRVIAAGNLKELRDLLGERDILRFTGKFPEESVRESIQSHDSVEILLLEGTNLHLSVVDASQNLSQLIEVLRSVGSEIRETTMSQPNLESLFIKLTGKELRD